MLTSQTRPGPMNEDFGRDLAVNVPPIARTSTPINEEALARAMMAEFEGPPKKASVVAEKQKKAREAIAVFIAKNPGISITSIVEALGMGNSTVADRADELAEMGLIKCVKAPGKTGARCYWPIKADPKEEQGNG